MRYRHLHEAIATRPRDMRLYLTNRLKALDTIIARLALAKDLVHTNAPDGDSILRSAIRYGAPDEDLARDINRLEYLDLARDYELKNIHSGLEAYFKYIGDRDNNFLKYVFGYLEYVRPVDDQTRGLLKLLPYAEAGFAEYGFEAGNPAHEADPEYQAAKKLLQGYRISAACLPQVEALVQDIKTKLGVVQAMRSTWDIEKYRPEHGETESLYHATAYVTEILRDGFQPTLPTERRGLGNFGTQAEISFTHDLEIARNIMRSLKEMWMIAHGELTGNTIMKWAQAEGIEDQLRKSWRSLTGGPIPWSRDADPKKVAYLYRYWLSASKLRSDPMMTYPDRVIDMLIDRKLEDIGVLVCEVRLEAEDRYLIGEAEFRLPPDRVLSVKRVL